MDETDEVWTGRGKVRARTIPGGVEIAIDGVTTQARYYKPLVYEFFRIEFAHRPRWGDFEVEIRMVHAGDPPRMDLDNLAKAARRRGVFLLRPFGAGGSLFRRGLE